MATKVFTNGCFDILHRGHLDLLHYCRHRAGSSGEVIVGLNSDESVKKLKGDKRPINSEKDRKYMLESLSCVDRAIIFNEDSPRDLIERIKPGLIVKGSQAVPKQVEIDGYPVWYFKHVGGYSTTDCIDEILRQRTDIEF